ncbi:MAG: PQQ-binding-like beta-propeller repeat protein [Janthinobacterium lividum]
MSKAGSLLPAVLAATLMAAPVVAAQQVRTTWHDYLGGPDSSHYSGLSQIHTGNVNKLEVAWSYPTGDDLIYTFSPLVVDDLAYFAAKQGSLVAVEAASGKEIWTHNFGAGTGSQARFAGIAGMRGCNYWESKDRKDRRLLVTAAGAIQALDARTGKLVESFADHGKLDLKTGIDRATRPLASRSAGRVFGDTLILGSATGEGYLAPPGDIRAFDIPTGKLLWVFHTIPRPGEFGYDSWPKDAYKYMGGVDVWGEISVDVKRGIAYFPVASAKYELYGGDRPGNNLYADCLLALDIRTGKHLWHYQTIHHDVWDYDPDAAPQLVTVKHEGKTVDAVALASKNGFLYVFDRTNGKPLWPIVEKPFPAGDVPGETYSKTQPIPTVVPPFVHQGMTVKDMYTGFMLPEDIPWWTERLSKARTGLYTPPSTKYDTINEPSVNGGALFFSTGADTTTGTVFVLGKNMPSIVKLVEAGGSTTANAGGLVPSRPPGTKRKPEAGGVATKEQLGRAVFESNCAVCHGADLKGDRGPAIDTAVARLGVDGVHNTLMTGRPGMPSFAGLPQNSMSDLLSFLKQPDLAPLGTAATPAAQTMARTIASMEPAYPGKIEEPPSRYKTGYGNEPYIARPPWTTITAYDLNTGKIKWQAPAGDLPQAGPSDTLRGNVYPKSGFVITGGGLVLFAGNDSKLYAYDSKTGKVVFTKDLPNGSQGVPAVYEVGGREYILLAVSGGATPYPEGAYMPPGGKVPAATSKSYMAFALPVGEK